MCFKVLKQFADKQTLTRKLLGSSFHPPGAASLLLSTVKPRSLNPFRLDSGRAVYFRPFVIDFRPFSFRICGEMYVLHANNMLFVLLIQQKASMASPVCGLQGKSHAHPPPLPLSRSLVRSFPNFFYFFLPRVLTGTNCRFVIWCYS